MSTNLRKLAKPAALALSATVVALAAPGGASAMDTHDGAPGAGVSIAYAAFTPARVSVLAGDTVTWTNDSARAHTIAADDDSFTSSHLVGGGNYGFRFTTPGTFLYHCQLHPSMRGEVDVQRLLLEQPTAAAAAGRPFPLNGRAALPQDSNVTIEADEGTGFHAVATAAVGAGGAFGATVTPRTTTRYRVVSGDEVSTPVQLVVLDRTVKVSVASGSRRSVVTATVSPASPGATVVLQLRLRERFGWWPSQQRRLDRHSRVRFVLPRGARAPARVVLTLRDGATTLAVSRTVHLGR